MAELRLRFWKFIHRKLESSWHWVYYHKIGRAELTKSPVSYRYNYTYFNSKAGKETPVFDGIKIHRWPDSGE